MVAVIWFEAQTHTVAIRHRFEIHGDDLVHGDPQLVEVVDREPRSAATAVDTIRTDAR